MDLASRQNEINEWTYNNKMDSLFVFQLIFISLLTVALLTVLSSQGYIGSGFVRYVMMVLAFIVVIVIINRYVYTRTTRDKRYWNRKRFGQDTGVGSPLTRGDSSYQQYIDSIRNNYGSGVTNGAGKTCKC
jgi:hypothetical protein